MINLQMHIENKYFQAISALPWDLYLNEWEKTVINKLNIKHGLCRHPIIFIKEDGFKFAIKETNGDIARKEIHIYHLLKNGGLPTLEPVGYIIREEEPIIEQTVFGSQIIRSNTGYVITILAEKVLPESRLYHRKFTLENRTKIWDAVVNLFVQLHSNNFYWGDASLANMLIHFKKEKIPNLGKKTVLEAILADAETVEHHQYLSKSLRHKDLENLFESMDWFAEELRHAGIGKDSLLVEQGKRYILEQYKKAMTIQKKEEEFEGKTHLDVKKLLGDFSEIDYGDILLKHIQEHKWYINEKSHKEITIAKAAQNWYDTVFTPVCNIFRKENLMEIFPGKTASDLYVEIMQHKYYLSENANKDVGFTSAMNDYCQKFGEKPSSPSLLKIISNAVLKIFGKREKSP